MKSIMLQKNKEIMNANNKSRSESNTSGRGGGRGRNSGRGGRGRFGSPPQRSKYEKNDNHRIKKNNFPVITSMSKGRDSIELLNDTITKIRHAVSNTVNKRQQDEGIKLIQDYEDRVKLLQCNEAKYQNSRPTTTDEELLDTEFDEYSDEELPKWEDVEHLKAKFKCTKFKCNSNAMQTNL